ncbi:DUF6356 family protein [Allosphingosinicella indica]|uniref:Uncharacterized protein n=1 Tax=Allosphingosinicella indica TaxID=941907 RepID=A0A1X7G050_9SPHN|nr:DUF6356 family protein [Allosphingosinicella indica]SMF61709.1 hypothetical protein SAMN06295910_0701 [Allosphingosinicella indica]
MPGLIPDSRDHLDEVGEDYFEHMGFALAVGRHMALAGIACMIHALVPALFPRTASTAIRDLHAVIEHRGDTRFLRRNDGGLLILLTLLALYAATLPWIAGSDWFVAAPVSALALGFPIAFALGREAEPA